MGIRLFVRELGVPDARRLISASTVALDLLGWTGLDGSEQLGAAPLGRNTAPVRAQP